MIVLIDNDKLIHLSWKIKAKLHGVDFQSYFSIEEFLKNSEKVPLTAIIYVDSELGDGVQGEVESLKISSLGYQKIYLSTGFQQVNLKEYPWITGQVSKSPPF